MEINAGNYYLRAPLAGPGAIDDRYPVLDAFGDEQLRRYASAWLIESLDEAVEYIAGRLDSWRSGTRCTWAVAEPTTGAMVGEVGLTRLDFDNAYGEVSCWTLPAQRGRGVQASVLPAVLRFGFGGLDLHHIGYRHAASNVASERLAKTTGFTLDGRLREATRVDGRAEDLLIWSKLATDRG